ncbi:gephyrin [Mytilus galloprovincialis]|uniref:Gephyrin n=1 Tax=Mytilus galloprovincialis TaxID=29158 RepID=A0A8B6BUT0_MYTGA|nr:gephyrin [Mytilus galloprovincialis]
MERKKKQSVLSQGAADLIAVRWSLYCPGKGNCIRKCGGIGQCTNDCTIVRKRHDRHACEVMVTAKIMLSNLTKWKVSVTGSHVNANNHDDENQMQWEGPSGNKKILESAKDNIMFSRSYGMKPFEVFRRQIKDISESEMEIAFKDTRTNPSDRRVCDFIKNTEKRHAFNSGQWTSAHKLAITELKESGQLLFYQRDNVEEAGNQDLDRGYVFAVSNQTALQSARQNQHVIGIDGKHGLQDDGAALMTAVTQHKDGFGCPASFTIMNRDTNVEISTSGYFY